MLRVPSGITPGGGPGYLGCQDGIRLSTCKGEALAPLLGFQPPTLFLATQRVHRGTLEDASQRCPVGHVRGTRAPHSTAEVTAPPASKSIRAPTNNCLVTQGGLKAEDRPEGQRRSLRPLKQPCCPEAPRDSLNLNSLAPQEGLDP